MEQLDTPVGEVAARKRFRGWSVLVATILFGQPIWLAGVRLSAGDDVLLHVVTYAGLILFTLIGFVLFALLNTTPTDAIRLRPVTSVATIVFGTLWLQGSAIMLLPRDTSPADRLLLASLNSAAVIVPALLLAARGRSAWWATVLGWLPLLIIGRLDVQWIALLILFATFALLMGTNRTEPTPPRPPPLPEPFDDDETKRPEH